MVAKKNDEVTKMEVSIDLTNCKTVKFEAKVMPSEIQKVYESKSTDAIAFVDTKETVHVFRKDRIVLMTLEKK